MYALVKKREEEGEIVVIGVPQSWISKNELTGLWPPPNYKKKTVLFHIKNCSRPQKTWKMCDLQVILKDIGKKHFIWK